MVSHLIPRDVSSWLYQEVSATAAVWREEREAERKKEVIVLSQVPLNNPLLLPLTMPFPIFVQLNITHAKDYDTGWT